PAMRMLAAPPFSTSRISLLALSVLWLVFPAVVRGQSVSGPADTAPLTLEGPATAATEPAAICGKWKTVGRRAFSWRGSQETGGRHRK
ncbi:MAG: hypothetical protein ACK48R_20130, partial [Planctomyces sp.]